MRFSRRSFLGAAAGAAAAAAALASGEASTTGVAAAMRARVSGDVVGKITVGQQGWFACARDGAPIGCWWHWSPDWSKPPSPPANGNLKAWPSMSGYARGYPTAYANLGGGRPATL